MKTINTHGLKIYGLTELAKYIKNFDFRDTATNSIQIFYDIEGCKIFGKVQSLNWRTVYNSEDVLYCGKHRQYYDEQGLADVVYEAFLKELAFKEYSNDGTGVLYNCDIYKDDENNLYFTEPKTQHDDKKLIAEIRSSEIYLHY